MPSVKTKPKTLPPLPRMAKGKPELVGQADDRRDLVPRAGQDDIAGHLRAGQRKGIVGIGPEDGRVVRGPVPADDLPELPRAARPRRSGRPPVLAPVLLDVVLERLHDRGRLHAGHEMALGVADAAERAGVGDVEQGFRDRDPVFGEAAIEVHPALGVIGDEVLFRARRAEPGREIVDLAHGVVPALGRHRPGLQDRSGAWETSWGFRPE